jgi:hypothetical protein
MKWEIKKRQKWLYRASIIVLLAGLGGAIMIYWAAMADLNSESGYEVVGGFIYPSAENSKKYVHDLQLYGGNAAMLADEFTHWFFGLWHGKSLAFTVACITIFISFALYFVATNLPLLHSDDHSGDKQAGTR